MIHIITYKSLCQNCKEKEYITLNEAWSEDDLIFRASEEDIIEILETNHCIDEKSCHYCKCLGSLSFWDIKIDGKPCFINKSISNRYQNEIRNLKQIFTTYNDYDEIELYKAMIYDEAMREQKIIEQNGKIEFNFLWKAFANCTNSLKIAVPISNIDGTSNLEIYEFNPSSINCEDNQYSTSIFLIASMDWCFFKLEMIRDIIQDNFFPHKQLWIDMPNIDYSRPESIYNYHDPVILLD